MPITEQSIEDMASAFALMLNASSVDIWDFVATFEQMVLTPVKTRAICKLDGQLNISLANKPIWERIHPDDMLDMAMRWCAFFVMPSQEGQPTTSEMPSESPTEPMVV